MTTSYLICEGPADGLDTRLLDMMIVQKFGKPVVIYPACGDATVRSVAEHYRERSRTKLKDGTWGNPKTLILSVQDRNFNSLQEVEKSWEPNSTNLIWHRHEIENYLLDPRVIAKAFENLRNVVQRWPQELPTTVEGVKDLMQSIATSMVEDFVGWKTYWDLISSKRNLVETRFLYPGRSNQLPKTMNGRYVNRQSWIEYLHAECDRLKSDCEVLLSLKEFTYEYIDSLYDENLAVAKSNEFWSTGRYIEDMGGHELFSALLKKINDLKIPISLSDLENELLKSLEQTYSENFYPVDDFRALANRMN